MIGNECEKKFRFIYNWLRSRKRNEGVYIGPKTWKSRLRTTWSYPWIGLESVATGSARDDACDPKRFTMNQKGLKSGHGLAS
jgi:hypothetical protein